MEISLNTPALLFPALSLLLLAFTNRFVVLANLIRKLHEDYLAEQQPVIMGQIHNLRTRIRLIKHMQAAGIFSMLLCVVCMFVLFAGNVALGKIIFGASLIAMIISLALSLAEIFMSIGALDLLLQTLEDKKEKVG